MHKILTIGFDELKPELEAVTEALEEFSEAAARDNYSVTGTPSTTVITDDPQRLVLGEYAVRVEGEWSNGD